MARFDKEIRQINQRLTTAETAAVCGKGCAAKLRKQ
jgi:hypothetical protein